MHRRRSRCRRCGCARGPSPCGSRPASAAAYSSTNRSSSAGSMSPRARPPRSTTLRRASRRLVDPGGVAIEEREVRVTALEQRVDDRERDRQIGARAQRDVKVGAAGERRRARIDDDELRAGLARALDHRHEVDAGRRRVHAPHDDQLRVRVVLERDARHRAVRRRPGPRVVAAAQNVRSRFDAPSRRKNRVASAPSVSQPFEPP